MPRLTMALAISVVALCLSGVPHASAAAPPQVTPDAQVSPGDCGRKLNKPGGGSWACTFVDNFTGTSLDRTKWLPQIYYGTGTPESRSCNVDDPNNVAVGGGHLQLTVRKVATPVQCSGMPANYTSASVSTYKIFSQQYGRFEARMKVHATRGAVPGLQEAFWLWPDVRVPSDVEWPEAGEIDIAELYSQYNRLAVPFLHYTANNNGGPIPGVNTAYCAASRGRFVTYTLIWTPSTLTIQVNGRTCLVNSSGDPAFQKPYILVFSSMLGVGANALTAKTPIPATMRVDWVKVWS
ncbi:MAG: glycoside hydrolase family 16 protein [Aeromicrobium sp.]